MSLYEYEFVYFLFDHENTWTNKKNHLNVISFAIPSHTRLSTALFSLYSICCVHSRIFFFFLCISYALCFTLHLSIAFSLSLSSYLFLSLPQCVCLSVYVYVFTSSFDIYFQHAIKFFFSRPAMKHDSPQICAMIRSILVAAVAPNRISMHHDATMVPPINQQPIVHFLCI